MQKKHLNILLIAAFFSSTLTLFGPLQIYFTNVLEFSPSFSEIIFYLVPLFLLLLSLLFLGLFFLKGKVFEKAASIVFILSFLLWLQGNILVWSYGLLDGQTIDWGAKWYLGIIDCLIWATFLLITILYSSVFINNIVRPASLIFILLQLISVFVFFIKAPEIERRYSIDDTDKFTFSKGENIIFLVIDTFQSDLFQELIDVNPDIKNQFQGFTYFRDAVSGYSTTYPSIPNILTGKYYDNSLPIEEFIKKSFLSETSLLKNLNENGFKVELYPLLPLSIYYNGKICSNIKNKRDTDINVSTSVAHLYDVTMFRYIPHYLKRFVLNNYNWLLKPVVTDFVLNQKKKSTKVTSSGLFSTKAVQKLDDIKFIDEMIVTSRVKSNTPIFKFYHLRGLHAPFKMNEQLEYQELNYKENEHYRKVSKGLLSLVKLFLEKLKDIGIYDNSFICILADHGNPYERLLDVKVSEHKSYERYENQDHIPPVKGAALPLLLIKQFKAQGKMKISMAPVALSDITKTVLSELEMKNDHIPGKSVFEVEEDEKRNRKFYHFMWKPEMKGYLNELTEYVATDFAWLDKSWIKTGKVYKPQESDQKYFERRFKEIVKSKKQFKSPIFYTQSNSLPEKEFVDNSIMIYFANIDPVKGDYIGLKIPIVNLEKGKTYKIRFEIGDTYNHIWKNQFQQIVTLNNKIIYRHDIGGDKFSGWKSIEHIFTAGLTHFDLKAEVHAVGEIRKGVFWGPAAKIGIRKLEIQETNKRKTISEFSKPDYTSNKININAPFGDRLELVSVKPVKTVVKSGESIQFNITWRFDTSFPQDKVITYYIGNRNVKWPPVTFKDTKGMTVHPLLKRDLSIEKAKDETSSTNFLLYQNILPRKIVKDFVTIPIPKNTASGMYELSTFVYPPDGYELPVELHSRIYPNQKFLLYIEVQ